MLRHHQVPATPKEQFRHEALVGVTDRYKHGDFPMQLLFLHAFQPTQ